MLTILRAESGVLLFAFHIHQLRGSLPHRIHEDLEETLELVLFSNSLSTYVIVHKGQLGNFEL
jgi:hypothetical protein